MCENIGLRNQKRRPPEKRLRSIIKKPRNEVPRDLRGYLPLGLFCKTVLCAVFAVKQLF
jgi:hypothetical protein